VDASNIVIDVTEEKASRWYQMKFDLINLNEDIIFITW
jgi:hypothetical protein